MRMKLQDIPVPDELDQVVQESMNRIYSGQRRKRFRHCLLGCGTAAAVFAGGFFFCLNDPTLAASLPLIGHIFENMQDSFGYAGDYSQIGEALEDDEIAVQLESASSSEEMNQISEYTQTADGLTVTLSEIYCNDQAIYVTMQMKAEKPYPEVWGFQCKTKEQYSFNPTEQTSLPVIDGKIVDECTYAGVIRIDLNRKKTDMSEYDAAREKALAAGEVWDDSWDAYGENENRKKYVKEVEVPDEFTVELEFVEFFGILVNPEPPDYGKTQEELDAMSDDEWRAFMNQWLAENPEWGWHNKHQYDVYEGSWRFTLNVKKNTEDTQVVELNEVNEQGIGIKKVVRDRFEITMYDTYTDGAFSADYFPVMLDADGRLMDDGGSGSVNTVAIGDRDVSHVDIFLVPYLKWMDEMKGDYLREPNARTADGRTPKELLLDECAYHTEVEFEK